MQQRPVRYYITQDEDQTVVRSVPISRRAQSVIAPDERISAQQPETTQIPQPEPKTVAARVRAVIHRGGAGRK